jgi:thioredoxin-related protein/YHS domain-containing protein
MLREPAFVFGILFVVFLFSFFELYAQSVDPVKWENDLKRACQLAQTENRLTLVHFYSDCAPCASMNANVFTDPRIALELNRNFVAVRVDMNMLAALAKQYDVTVVPTDLILNSEGQVVYRRQGEIASEKYLQFLQYLRTNFLSSHIAKHNANVMPAAVAPATTATLQNNQTANNITNNQINPNANNQTALNNPAATPFATQPEQKNKTPETQNNFAFIAANNQHNQPSTTANNQQHYQNNPQHVIAASGQFDPNNTSAAVVATPSTNANAAANNITSNITSLPKNVPVTIPVVSDKNFANGAVESIDAADNNNINNNFNNFPNNNNVILTNTPNSPDNLQVKTDANGGLNSNIISVTNNPPNNPATIRNPIAENQNNAGITGGVIDLAGHLMVEVPLAIEGYCPVILCKKEEWVPGNPAYYAMYRGQVYRFSSQEAMTEFLKSPLQFAPVAMGEDVVMMIDRNKKICGSRKYGVWFGGRVYLFANKESLNNFIAKPDYYANIAQNYEAAFKSPLDTVQR